MDRCHLITREVEAQIVEGLQSTPVRKSMGQKASLLNKEPFRLESCSFLCVSLDQTFLEGRISLILARILLSLQRLQWHTPDDRTVNIHPQPSLSTKIAIPMFEKVCEIELSASVLRD